MDTFFWRHLVRPYLGAPRDASTEWNRLDSWEEHPSSAGFDGGLTLDDFTFTASGAALDDDSVWKIRKLRLTRSQALAWAERQHASLTGKGHMTGDQVRQRALANLSEPGLAAAIGAALTARFAELVVDEAQDCSDVDEELLLRLSEQGLPLLLVADTDQAVYGFRRAKGSQGHTIRPLPRDNALRLRHNWRSGQRLCRFTATLRGNPEPDVAVGRHRDQDSPVLLLPHAPGERHPVRAFHAAAEGMGVKKEETLVLAHRWSALPRELAGTAKVPSGDLARLVWAGEVLAAPNPGKRFRERARKALRSTLLDLWCAPEADSRVTEAERMRAAGIDTALFDRAEALVRYEYPSADLPLAEWERRLTSSLLRHSPYAVRTEPPGRVRWQEADAGLRTAPARRLYDDSVAPLNPLPGVGRTSSVHGVKGEEADAVLVMIPARRAWSRVPTVIDRWLDPGRDPDEDVRVLYVAATRARRLLALALPEEDLERVASFLSRRDVPYERSVPPGPGRRSLINR
ncbi:UvrD-helicase domain-containing protein [Nocardiopsis sp. HUAS JQ3]|uniref:UvrD-helicase domain-containing protein n=1 Tax=Nocardiopsis sp. HUAS JQ3 TaxID=3061629 RepID=UPI0023A99D4A|nr:UvrD-helicase domain-containing protein [Nocardiopsis sp. HUAS JQ3]WDZ88897.1 UvrD-helicase domain-containing protein [Nocardiopsis sp. HUAS JQ3]